MSSTIYGCLLAYAMDPENHMVGRGKQPSQGPLSGSMLAFGSESAHSLVDRFGGCSEWWKYFDVGWL